MERVRQAWFTFQDFLKAPPGNFRDWCKLALSALLFSLAWAFVVETPLRWVAMAGSIGQHVAIWDDFFQAAAKEEVIFRWMPLVFLMMFSRAKPVRLMLGCALFASTCFGLIHVPKYTFAVGLGWAILFSLLIQGVLGFIWSFIFIKCSTKADIFLILPLLTTTLIHFSYNMVLVYIRMFL